MQSLQVYQKIEVPAALLELATCSEGLIAISKEKGYLSLYRFEGETYQATANPVLNILSVQQNSNNLLIEAGNVRESIYYKLVLSNKPRLTQHSRKPNLGKTPQIQFIGN